MVVEDLFSTLFSVAFLLHCSMFIWRVTTAASLEAKLLRLPAFVVRESITGQTLSYPVTFLSQV